MMENFQVQELLIVIAVRQQNPSILTADFLKYTGIIPSDWELARPPVLTNTAAQVVYQNGVSIVAEVNRVILQKRSPIKKQAMCKLRRSLINILKQSNKWTIRAWELTYEDLHLTSQKTWADATTRLVNFSNQEHGRILVLRL